MDYVNAYYKAFDPDRRKGILLAGMQLWEQPPEEDEIRIYLWERRYGQRAGMEEHVDYFLRSLQQLQTLARSLGSLFGRGRMAADAQHVWRDLCLEEAGPVSHLTSVGGTAGGGGTERVMLTPYQKVLSAEFDQLFALYAQLCQTEREGHENLVRKPIEEKLAEDVYMAACVIPDALGAEKEFELFTMSMLKAYGSRYDREKLQALLANSRIPASSILRFPWPGESY